MSNSLKSACLSGLVYPGLGQIYQKHYIRGGVLSGIVSACIIMILLKASGKINKILANIASSNSELDITTVIQQVYTFETGQEYLIMKTLTALILCCWAIAIVDAYLSGKRIDSRNSAHNNSL